VAASAYPYALGVKVVELPGLEAKGDVSDYLKTHTADDILAAVKNAPRWFPKTDDRTLIPVPQFLSTIPQDVDWMVKDVIERGANGFICADPKVGKSWLAADLVLSLAMGIRWLGFAVNRPYRVALVSREDTPGLTAWRLKHLMLGKTGDVSNLESNLWVNSRQQTASFKLDNDEELAGMIQAMTERRIEFAIFDVMNVLHSSDENDNQEMREILARLSEIGSKVGCGIGVVHHYKKDESGSMTKRLRGSSAISGWAEWLIGLTLAEDKIRRVEFELKAGNPPDPVYFVIDSNDSGGVAMLKHVEYRATRKQAGSLLQ
jgi:RecA-family ATPase